MLFALIAYDRPNAVADRMALRPDHLVHLQALGDKLMLAGPFLNDAGEMNGSIVVVEAADQGEAETLFGRDPYMTEGLFASHEIRPWKVAINNLGK